jgi:hypothetical protein
LAFVIPATWLGAEPAYPFITSPRCSRAGVALYALVKENKFLPDLDVIPEDVAGSQGMFINYPNNPTGPWPSAAFTRKLSRLPKSTTSSWRMTRLTARWDERLPAHELFGSAGAKDVGSSFIRFENVQQDRVAAWVRRWQCCACRWAGAGEEQYRLGSF